MNLQDLIKEYETDKTTETDGLVYDKYKATLNDGRDIPLVEMLEIFCTLHGSAVRSPARRSVGANRTGANTHKQKDMSCTPPKLVLAPRNG